MKSSSKGNLIGLRLEDGEDLQEKLKEVARINKLKAAIVLSGIGMLREAELGYFRGPKEGYLRHYYSGPCELVSLSGNISLQEDDYNLHLHAVLITSQGEAVGGHLFKGKVNITNEIFLLKIDIPIYRRLEDTGLLGLYFE